MEAALVEVVAARGSPVRTPKAELDLLVQLEAFRDAADALLAESSAGRAALAAVFGGGAGRLARARAVLDNVVLSDMNAGDQRWETCLRTCESVERVLADLGHGWAPRPSRRAAAARGEPEPEAVWETAAASPDSEDVRRHASDMAVLLQHQRLCVSPKQQAAQESRCSAETCAAFCGTVSTGASATTATATRASQVVRGQARTTSGSAASGTDRTGDKVATEPDSSHEAPADDVCMQKVVAAVLAETEAVSLDRAGKTNQALQRYKECKRLLTAAIDVALPAHDEDHPKLLQHRSKVIARIRHLQGLSGGASEIPVERHIQPVELHTMQVFQLSDDDPATDAEGPTESGGAANLPRQLRKGNSDADGWKTLVACAALGAGALTAGVAGGVAGGVLVLGGAAAASAGALAGVAGAVAGAHCATRDDAVGSAARRAGSAAVKGAERAKRSSSVHAEKLAAKLAGSGLSAGPGGAGLSSKLLEAQASLFDTARQVSDAVAGALAESAGGLARLTSSVARASSTAAPPRAQRPSARAASAAGAPCGARGRAASRRRPRGGGGQGPAARGGRLPPPPEELLAGGCRPVL